MKRRIVTFALAAILLAVSLPHASAADTRFPAVRTYAGQFADLDAGAWYYESAAALYELGLINGQDGRFAPDSEMTIAEAVTMAARLRSLYEHGDSEAGPSRHSGGEWYKPYAAYLQELQVIDREFDGLYQQAATRAQMAHILANTLPQDLFEPINGDVVAAGYANRNYIRGPSCRKPIFSAARWRLWPRGWRTAPCGSGWTGRRPTAGPGPP